MNKTALAILALVALGLAVFLWNVTSQPAPQDQAVTPSTTAQPTAAPIVEVALPTELSSEAQIGKRAFEAKCAQCHGVDAAGNNSAGPPLVHKIYEPNHHGDAAFLVAVRNGVRQHHWDFGNMMPVEGLTDADVKYIVQYVRELQQENGIR
ncbi:hypothetical protein DEA8626_04049 [Defluviimonas aquaemixtae]|uniref:Cytochrome c domain-containing protein n=1 Tax=Albidovulum aquaemixtae TaxID=1542388 RepID=A0A2R8BNR7_9RHOB|nr:cytochrome c [Defluviimonas aquaemixtae]SPH25014.1 hypothetical protein DEA8626_04049 [Defluviimonas aquaemixtae]